MKRPPFLRTLGSKNRFSATSCDQLPLMMASYLMFGHQLLFPVPDVGRTDFMMILGANPLASNGSIMAGPGIKKRLEAISKRGGKVVVVDPRRSETARIADEHVFIRPGTDAAFVLALVHVLFDEGRANPGRMESHANGLERLRDLVRDFSPEAVAPMCGIDPETTRRIARELSDAPSAATAGRRSGWRTRRSTGSPSRNPRRPRPPHRLRGTGGWASSGWRSRAGRRRPGASTSGSGSSTPSTGTACRSTSSRTAW